MQSKEYAALVNQVGRIALAVKPADESPVFENCSLAVFYLRSAATALGKAESLMARIENNGTGKTEKPGSPSEPST